MDSHLARLIAASAVAVLGMITPGVAQATFAGENGKLAFIRHHADENADLWTVNQDGTGLQRLSNNEVFSDDSAYDSGPTWSPDGRKILFQRYVPSDAESGLFTINADGSGLTRLAAWADASHAWLPDGRVAFARWGPAAGLYTVNPDGTGERRIGPYPDGPLTWSADATRFVVTRWTLEGSTAWVSDPAGTGMHVLFEIPRYQSAWPAWGPGPRIAFVRQDAAGHHWDIRTIEPDGTGERPLTDDPPADFLPQWSPDGTRVLFLTDRNAKPDDVFDVYAIAADGTGLRQLTATTTGSDVAAVWSPDSRTVAFVANAETSTGLYTVDDSGHALARVTSPPAGEHDAMPAWQPLARSTFRNSAAFCHAQRAAAGARLFAARHGRGAFGRCVSAKVR